MKKRVTVAAIVPTFNRSAYLGECLDSLLSQSVLPSELIIVDDGSTDRTRELVTGLGASITYLYQENAGKSAALNLAMARLSSDAIWIVDDDDIAAPMALECLSEALADDPGAGIAFGDMEGFSCDEHGRRRRILYAGARFDPDDLHLRELMRCSLFQPAMLTRRRCYEEVGPFDEQLSRSQDYDMLLRLTSRFRAVHVDRVVFYQRSHGGTRGPASLRMKGEELSQRQAMFDRIVLKKAFDRSELADFLPRSERERELDPARRFRALLRRSAAMSRRGLWMLGADDLSQALEIAAETGIKKLPREAAELLSSALMEARDEAKLMEASRLLQVVSAAPKGALRNEMLRALSWQLFLNGLKALAQRRLRSATRLLRTYLWMTAGRYLPAHGWRLLIWAGARP